METVPGIVARIYEFVWALLPYWWLLVSGIIFAVEPMIEGLAPTSLRRSIEKWWPKERRYRHFRIASVAALFIASFLAFDDVNTRNKQLEHSGAHTTNPFGLVFEITAKEKSVRTSDYSKLEYHQWREIVLILRNELPYSLTNLHFTMTKASGPTDGSEIPTPESLDVLPQLNSGAYISFDLAEYMENPPGDHLCLHIGKYIEGTNCLWSNQTNVEYTFFATAAESRSATITIRIWIEDNKLRYKMI